MNAKNLGNLTRIEQLSLLRSAFYFSVALIVLLLLECSASFLFYFLFSKDAFILYAVLLFSVIQLLIAGFFSLIWSRKLVKDLAKSPETLQLRIKLYRKFGWGLFIGLLVLVLLNAIMIIGLIFHRRLFLSENQANSSAQSYDPQQLGDDYKGFIVIEFLIFFLKTMLSFGIGQAISSSVLSIASLRQSLAFSLTGTSILAFMGLYFSKQANNYLLSFQGSDSIIDTTFLNGVFSISLVMIIISAIGLIISTIRWRSIYMVFSSLLLISTVVIITLGSLLIRNSHSLNQLYQGNCPELLRQFSQDFLIDIDCPYKYVEKSEGGYSTDCESEEIGLVWDSLAKASQPEVSLACLNYDCCGLLAVSLVEDFFLLGITLILAGGTTFVSGSVSLVLSLKSDTEANYFAKNIDFFRPNVEIPSKGFYRRNWKEFLGFLLMIISAGIFLIASNYWNSTVIVQDVYYPFIQGSNVEESTTLIGSQSLYSQLSSQTENSKICNNITDGVNTTQMDELIWTTTEGNTLRIALLGESLKFDINFNFGKPGLRLFTVNLDTYKTVFFPNASESSDFILFEGEKAQIEDFLLNSVRLCATPYAQIRLFSIKYEKNENTRLLSLANHKSSSSLNYNHKKNHKSTFPSIKSKAAFAFDCYTWGHLKGTVFDESTGNGLSNVNVALVSWKKTVCDYQSSNELSRTGYTDSVGNVTFLNLIKKTYTLIFTKTGYKTNCLYIDFHQNSSLNEFQAVLIPEFSGESEFLVTLEWLKLLDSNTSIDLHLQGTFTKDDKPCFTSVFAADCPEMYPNKTRFFAHLAFQKIIIKSTFSTKYLFFLMRLPLNSESSSRIEEFKPMIKLYGADAQSPIQQFEMPFESNDNGTMRNPVWMAFCFDGEAKDVDVRQRVWSGNGTVSVPTAAFCTMDI